MVDQVSTAATEMSAAVHDMALNVQNASDAARASEDQSRNGAALVSGAIQSIRQLLHEVEGASRTIEALAEQASSTRVADAR